MTLRRLRLGQRLCEWRESAGLSREEVAGELGCTPGRVRHLENGRNLPSRPDLIVLAQLYGLPDAERDVLLDTRVEAKRPGWWQTYKLPKWLASYVALEDESATVENFEPEVIPGLLQVPRYAEAITGSVQDGPPNREKVDARVQRQRRLTDDHPVELSAVIGEAALRQCLADRDLAREQYDHLLTMLDRSNIAIQVLPFALGVHSGMGGSFVLLGFADGQWPRTAYQEYQVGGHLVDEADAVARFDTLYALLRERALTEDDSAGVIKQYRARAESEA